MGIMTQDAVISLRVNADDKKQFEIFCEKTGMNVSTAINMYIKAVIREQRLPFKIETEK